jgi:predicted glycoside hydrolase/deacetylase ChbG (UPF0249 family)
MPAPVLLCADDYALAPGVSRAIEELAEHGRLSATSALVTTPDWPEHGKNVAALRAHIAVGLHIDLTLGPARGASRTLAPDGTFPRIGKLIRRALAGTVKPDDVQAEVLRQIERFVAIAGRLPDFVDGHQHAHALPNIRAGVLAALSEAFPSGGILVRDPSDRASRILARKAAVGKSLLIASLSSGFGAAARERGFLTNDGFSGVSPFARTTPFSEELARFFAEPGPRHLVMCHPGYVDDALRAVDPVVERRRDELDTLTSTAGLPERLWRPVSAGGPNWDTPVEVAAA